MEWWQWTEIGIDFGVPGFLALVGILLVIFVGRRKCRRKAARRCFGCGYDMRMTQGLVCVECGYAARDQREVEHGRAIGKWVWVGLVLCVPAIWVVGFFAIYGWSGMERRAIVKRHWSDDYDVSARLLISKGEYPESEQGWLKNARLRLVELVSHEPGTLDLLMEHFAPNEEHPEFGVSLNPDDRRLGWTSKTRVWVYLTHAWLFPVDHYWGYFCRAGTVTVMIDGPEDCVISEQTVRDLGNLENCYSVNIAGPIVDGKVMEAMGKLKNLKYVAVYNVVARPQEVAEAFKRGKVEGVWLGFRRPLEVEDLRAIGTCPGLRSVELEAPWRTPGDFDGALAELILTHDLETLKVKMPVGAKGELESAERVSEAPGQSKRLEALTLNVGRWTPEQLSKLGEIKMLESVDLTCGRNSRDKAGNGLGWIGKRAELKSVALEGFGDVALDGVPETGWELDSLWLGSVRVHGRLLQGIRGAKMRRLTLWETELSNAELDALVPELDVGEVLVSPWVCGDEACRRMGQSDKLWRIEADDMSEKGLELLLSQGKRKSVMLWKASLPQEKIKEINAKYPKSTIQAIGAEVSWEMRKLEEGMNRTR